MVWTQIGAPPAWAAAGALPAAKESGDASSIPTRTPLKHVIVVIGENHTYDNVFATWTPPHGEHARNLLSEHIVTEAGACGAEADRALQRRATDTDVYRLTP